MTHLLERRPPTVPDAIRSPGREPPPAARRMLAHRFGRDFAELRLHTDERAGASALALGAEAYTVGRDIVFAPGAFAPGTARGDALLAHEATHALQQGLGAYAGGALAIEPAASAAEREAGAVAAGQGGAVAAGGGLRVQRSLAGALVGGGVGGVLGGVGLGLLGSLLGPAGAALGAVVGALGGAVGGALLGDVASRRQRSLTAAEQAYLREIFHDSVDFAPVVIVRDTALAAGAPRTTGNTINLQAGHFVGDTMDLSPHGWLTLAHEMGHVWQHQNGGLSYIPSSLIPQAVAASRGLSRNVAYEWRACARMRLPWEQWNAEQQAECIGDWNEALRRTREDRYPEGSDQKLRDYETLSMAEPYIALVRQRVGAPGSRQRRGEGGAP